MTFYRIDLVKTIWDSLEKSKFSFSSKQYERTLHENKQINEQVEKLLLLKVSLPLL